MEKTVHSDGIGPSRWDAYAQTVVRIKIGGTEMEISTGPVGRCLGPFPDEDGRTVHIITAFNPEGRARQTEENDRAQQALESELRDLGLVCWPAEGGNATRTWVEPSVAVVGLDDDTALEIGRRFGQDTIFAWSPSYWRILACSGRVRTTGWTIAGDHPAPARVHAAAPPSTTTPSSPEPPITSPAAQGPVRLPADRLYPSGPIGETDNVILRVRAWRMSGKSLLRVLHVREDRVELLTRRGKDPVEILDFGPLPADALAVALAEVPDLLTIPSKAAAEIDCLSEIEHKVADLIELTGDPSANTVEDFFGYEDLGPLPENDEDWDDEEWEYYDEYSEDPNLGWPPEDDRHYWWYEELATVGIRINRVLHRAALVQGRWTLIPMDTSQDFPPQPLMSVEYTSDSYGFDGGSPISNSHWWEGSGAVRDGLHVAWAAYDEGGYILIERCDADEFQRRVAEWGGLGRPDEGVVDE